VSHRRQTEDQEGRQEDSEEAAHGRVRRVGRRQGIPPRQDVTTGQ
jgi:hypothetical protein